ncbi:hypothetical protein DVZ84_24375 [Streptomyces parvulus]|uniref:Uncharacterized protein n=1 Tax=Streptomyces parvulus TaxID=146923 RepID=A0A369V2E7_9ACTN|nr:hypothetical protein DVZ84_24375 [Streptomyces parvulus]
MASDGRPPAVAPTPQWRNLFLAPAYRGEAAEADRQERTATASVARRRRQGGRRISRPAA